MLWITVLDSTKKSNKEKMISDESSLVHLPGVKADKFGNLHFTGERVNYYGLRPRYEFVLKLDPKELKNTVLSELLNWLRWGAQTSVKWECTLPELVKLIEHWEKFNSDLAAYGFTEGTEPVQWEKLWANGYRYGIFERYFCSHCKKKYDRFCLNCSFCNRILKVIEDGPRGINSYDLILEGADGVWVAEAAWFSRGKLRVIPELRRI